MVIHISKFTKKGHGQNMYIALLDPDYAPIQTYVKDTLKAFVNVMLF